MTKKIIHIVAFFFLSMLLVNSLYAADQSAATSGNLTLIVTNIKNTNGTIRIALFDSEKAYRKSSDDGSTAFKTDIAKINPDGKIQVIFNNIPAGTYAIKLFQDEDNSGAIKTDWLGRPKEDFGFSNNVDASSGEPNFDQVKFIFDKTHNQQMIKMQKALVSK